MDSPSWETNNIGQWIDNDQDLYRNTRSIARQEWRHFHEFKPNAVRAVALRLEYEALRGEFPCDVTDWNKVDWTYIATNLIEEVEGDK